jgi:hypothetical protein
MDVTVMTPLKTEEDLKDLVLTAIASAKSRLSEQAEIGALQIDHVLSSLSSVKTENAPKTSTVVPRFQRLADEFRNLKPEIAREHPRDTEAAVNMVLVRSAEIT